MPEVNTLGAAGLSFRRLIKGFISYEHCLSLAKLAVLIFVIGILVAGRSAALWPIKGWPMYSRIVFEAPGEEHSQVYLHAYKADGTNKAIFIDRLRSELLTVGRDGVSRSMAECAIDPSNPDQEGCARHLLLRSGDRLGWERVDTIEVRKRTWALDAYAKAPLDLNNPVRDELVGRIARGPND